MWDNVIATVIRKSAHMQRGGLYLIVRSSAFAADQAIAVSRQDYDRFQPGMLVTLYRQGWGPIGKWGLR